MKRFSSIERILVFHRRGKNAEFLSSVETKICSMKSSRCANICHLDTSCTFRTFPTANLIADMKDLEALANGNERYLFSALSSAHQH